MLFKKSLSRGRSQRDIGLRLFLVIPLLSLLTSCTTFIPGLDRILFSNSSAKVGPLVTVDEQYPANIEEEVSTTPGNEPVVEPAAVSSELIAKTESDTKPTNQSSNAETPSTSRTVNPQSSTTKAKPTSTQKSKLPEVVSSEIAVEKEKIQIAIKYGAVAGKVVLIDEQKQQLPATETMITLTPTMMMDEVQNRPSQVHIIDMQDKAYQPRYSTVHAGDQVVFVNKDNIQHNVFSSSGNNAFDLGTYGTGLKRAVTLKEPGIVKIYCNIHADMATFVAVSNQGLSAKADDQGRYKIGGVLPGTYEVAIWNIRGEIKRIVEVKADETVELVDRIDTNALKVESHKNKFGGDYSKNSKLFEDEFY